MQAENLRKPLVEGSRAWVFFLEINRGVFRRGSTLTHLVLCEQKRCSGHAAAAETPPFCLTWYSLV